VINFQRAMLMDTVRSSAYQEAILEVVKKGDVVLDLGSGTGILSFFALQSGAKKVYGIEARPTIEVAKEVARVNKWSERIEFINKHSYDVTLPEKVDVIISEILGNFALDENLLDFIIDARNRFMKKEGSLIPYQIELFIVPVECPDLYQLINFLDEDIYGIDFSPARELSVYKVYVVSFEKEAFLSTPLSIQKIDLQIVNDFGIKSKVNFEIEREGTLHGLAGWFKAYLSPQVILSTAPGTPNTYWGNVFFPLIEPVLVKVGNKVTAQIEGESIPGEKEDSFVWKWNVSVFERRIEAQNLEPAKVFHHYTLPSDEIASFFSMMRSTEIIKRNFQQLLKSKGEKIYP